MIVMHKCEVGKAINKRSEKTHQKKVKIHMKNRVEQVNKGRKMNVDSFRIYND